MVNKFIRQLPRIPHLLQHYEEELYDDQLISIEQMLASFDFSEV